jgi:ATPase subunit of ABC transporter with duplicated ATPase domains
MGHVEVNGVGQYLPDGRPLLVDVSFRVDEGSVTALVGPNGAGKSTLFSMIAAAARKEGPGPDEGSISATGSLAVMPQFIGSVGGSLTVRDLLVEVAPPRLKKAAACLSAAEEGLVLGGEDHQLAYAQALSDWGDLGGYEAEVVWDAATTSALGLPLGEVGGRPVATLSGGEQKRLVLEVLLHGDEQVLLLDEPDNYLDVPGKEWLEAELAATKKTVLLISHDRELLRRAATRVVTLEPTAAGATAWVHGASYATYHQARSDRLSRLEELHRTWEAERARLRAYVTEMRQKASYNSDFASKLSNALHRLDRFERAGPPEAIPRPQKISVRLLGGRTGKRVVTCNSMSLSGLTAPFDLEILYGERACFLGPNGTGKSHFFRLLAGEPVSHSGELRLGARILPGHFAQSYEHPELEGRQLEEILSKDHDMALEKAVAALGRYELSRARRQRYETLSGGQQARFQILLLEISGATLLLLDEPTDNLDVESAEALETGLSEFEGTVLAITHDRYFARQFDRFFLFGADGVVQETEEAVFDEGGLERAAATRRKSRSL